MEGFRRLGIIQPVLRAIEGERFEKPSEIQRRSIPLVLKGQDVIAGSATGSGKTLVFGSGIIQNCEKIGSIQALILTPTRELANQITKALRKFSRYKPLEIVSVYGGVSINPQIEKLMRADVVVATPGRMLDHIQRRTIRMGRIKILVLDEADRMFDMGFIRDVERIIRECPKQRQTMLFSATISPEVAHIARRYMKNPVKVSAETYVDPKKMRQVYYDIDDRLKFSLLVHLLKKEHPGLIMVFSNTRKNTDFVADNLNALGVKATAIHGGFSQDKRDRTMNDFHAKEVNVLVCTDVAARGLDIKGVSHIYNYDIPKDTKEYIHRIGRTARAGKEGKVINLLSGRDHDNFTAVLRKYDVNIEKELTPSIQRVKIKRMEHRGRFRRSQWGFKRGSGRGPGRGFRGRGHAHQGQGQQHKGKGPRRFRHHRAGQGRERR